MRDEEEMPIGRNQCSVSQSVPGMSHSLAMHINTGTLYAISLTFIYHSSLYIILISYRWLNIISQKVFEDFFQTAYTSWGTFVATVW